MLPSIVTREIKRMETPSSNPVKAPRWGAYCLANDEALEWFQAFVRSFRKFNPTLPLTVIPYDSSIQKLSALQAEFSFSVMDEAKAAHFDHVAHRVAGQNIPGRTFRKLACFLGDYEHFLFLDSDIVVTMAYEKLLPAFDCSTYDLAYFDTDMMVFKPDFARKMMAQYDQFGFNSGALLVRRAALDEAKIMAAVASGEGIRDQFGCWGEQPFLNYLFQVSGCRTTHVHRLAPELTFKTKAWMPFQYDQSRQCFLDPEQGVFPLIHWAGHEYPTMIRPEVFLRFRTLGMTDAENRRYRRHFYCRRFRSRLKHALLKLPVFSGVLARREERLRAQRLRSAATA